MGKQAGKKILDKLKEIVPKENFLVDAETLKLFCNDAIGVRCIAFQKKQDGVVERIFPPNLGRAGFPKHDDKDVVIIAFAR